MRARRRRHAATNFHSQARQGHPAQDRWLISYADFVTLLFALFVVLFALTWHSKNSIHTVSSAIQSGFDSLSAHPVEGSLAVLPPPVASPPAAQTFDIAELSLQLHSILGDSISKHEIVMQQTPDGLIISLRELGFFNSGEAVLLPGAAAKLQQTAKVLMMHGLELRIEGHSDDQPIHNASYNSNWELSTARAMSVLTMLVDQAGFPPAKISVAGYGAFRPVGSNENAEGRRMNRRVDLVIVAPRSREERLR